MGTVVQRRIWLAVAAGVLLAAAAGGGLVQHWIRHEVTATATRAEEMFHAGRVDSLLQLVDCEGCPPELRNRAVWALGEMEDRRALAVLQSHVTGRKCDHERGLCQYELDKAIRKIERTWSVMQQFRL